MFYLDGRDGAKYDSSSPNGEENFGWWLSDRKIAVSSRSHHVKDHRSPGSSTSILSCISDDSDNCSFARDVSRQEQESGIGEKIELNLFRRGDLDIELIEKDARKTSNSPVIVASSERNIKEDCISPVCYTPERLIRSQEYRILIPSPRRFTSSETRATPENEIRDWKSRRKQLSRLLDSGQIGTQSKVFLSLATSFPPSFDPKSKEGSADGSPSNQP